MERGLEGGGVTVKVGPVRLDRPFDVVTLTSPLTVPAGTVPVIEVGLHPVTVRATRPILTFPVLGEVPNLVPVTVTMIVPFAWPLVGVTAATSGERKLWPWHW